MNSQLNNDFAKLFHDAALRINDASNLPGGQRVIAAISGSINKVIPPGLSFCDLKVARSEHVVRGLLDSKGDLPNNIPFSGQNQETGFFKNLLVTNPEYFVVRYRIAALNLPMGAFAKALQNAGDIGLGRNSVFLAYLLGISIHNTYSFDLLNGKVEGLYFTSNANVRKVPYLGHSYFAESTYILTVVPKWV